MIVTVEYDMISAIFCFVGAVLIRRCWLFKSLFYECNAWLIHYGNCNAEPTIIRRVLRDNLQNNCSCNLDCTEKAVIIVPFKKAFPKSKPNPWKVSVSDFCKELFSNFEGYRPAILPSRSTKYELLQMFY